MLEQGPNSADACEYQNCVGYGADCHNWEYMRARQTLAKNKGILCADRDDQRESDTKTDDGGRRVTVTEHVTSLATEQSAVQLMILRLHKSSFRLCWTLSS